MITSRPDPLKVPAELQQRVEAVSGLRALYRRGSFARSLGLACFAVLPATALLSMIFLQGLTGSPPSAHVPAGYGNDPSTIVLLLSASLCFAGGMLVWMGFGLRRVLLNRGVRHFTFSFVIGGSMLVVLMAGNGIVSPDFSRADAGDGTKLDSTQLGKLIDSPGFTTLSPQWQGYLQAQHSLARTSTPLNDTGLAIARGEDIGIAVPDVIRARIEAKARVPYSARSQAWLHAHWLRMGVLHFIGMAIAWSLLLLVIAGIGLTTLGYHVRGRARVINGLLQQLQPPPPQASAQA
ncbi:hypothetical protein D7Y44_08655 [Stenotrophomonas maltophilia]|uniref:hypothetical protein n=1 Tax=Stenotrophomonas maltophilia TaxID=40324 RepID=UPI0015DF8848|nr:hypothetical protein [Stenotrophomonas maltophilia]MBA0281633.1 hypothetical protein [Stenotrophomonas maltophilia]MBA0344505.1 hypothetical protein [Stenotrophomonas maltophilia]MBA0357509.1 hypothetical protein [Stenotrophomonas maltophilia]MBA0519639.1 hypothetical protein [Stenotrophomonas maltophilia]